MFGVPLNSEGETGGIVNADRLDGAVIGRAFDHHARAGINHALAVQRVHVDYLGLIQPGKDAPGRQIHFMANVIALVARYILAHAVVLTAGKVANLGVQCAALSGQ